MGTIWRHPVASLRARWLITLITVMLALPALGGAQDLGAGSPADPTSPTGVVILEHALDGDAPPSTDTSTGLTLTSGALLAFSVLVAAIGALLVSHKVVYGTWFSRRDTD